MPSQKHQAPTASGRKRSSGPPVPAFPAQSEVNPANSPMMMRTTINQYTSGTNAEANCITEISNSARRTIGLRP